MSKNTNHQTSISKNEILEKVKRKGKGFPKPVWNKWFHRIECSTCGNLYKSYKAWARSHF